MSAEATFANLKVSFSVYKPPGGKDLDSSELVTFTQEIHGYKIFGQPVMVGPKLPGPIVAEFTQLKLTQVTPTGESGVFKIELQTTEGSEQVVRYGSAVPGNVNSSLK